MWKDRKLRAAIESKGHIVDDHMHSDLTHMIEEHTCEVTSRHLPGSFPCVFWEQQLAEMETISVIMILLRTLVQL